MCFSPLNFLASKYCRYSPSVGVGDSHGMIFLEINCLPLLNELNNKKNKYRFNLFYYQWTLHREEQDRKRWLCTSSLVLSCRVVIIYSYVYFSLQTLSKLKRLFLIFCIASNKQCLVLCRSLKTEE